MIPVEHPPRLLFVCSGNLCRSPMAEGLARHLAEQRRLDLHADSAGTLDIEGRAPPPNAIAVMQRRGLSIHDHRSKGLRREHIAWADHVLVMTLDHAAVAHERDPSAGEKIKLLGPYGGQSTEIDDPIGWWRPTYEKVCRQLERCIDRLIDRELLSPER